MIFRSSYEANPPESESEPVISSNLRVGQDDANGEIIAGMPEDAQVLGKSKPNAPKSNILIGIGIAFCLTSPVPVVISYRTLRPWPYHMDGPDVFVQGFGESLIYGAIGCILVLAFRNFFPFLKARGIVVCVFGLAMWSVSMRSFFSASHLSDEMNAVSTQWTKDQDAMMLKYEERISTFDIQSFLAPRQLVIVPDIDKSAERLKLLKEIMVEYASEHTRIIHSLHSRIENSSLDVDLKIQRQKDFASVDQVFKNHSAAELAFIDAAVETLTYVRARQGKYNVVSDRLEFEDRADAEGYQRCMARLKATASRSDALAQQYLKQSTNAIKNLGMNSKAR